MKKLVILLMLALITGTAFAQADGAAAVEQVKSILKSGAADADKQIDAVAKPFKKDPETLTNIGRECLRADKAAKAEEYANRALEKNKNYGDAYILLGDVAIRNDDGGKAAEMFQQAMYMDKTNPEGYVRYAKIMAKSSPQSSLDALEQLKTNCPSYPADLTAAEIASRGGNMAKAIEYYQKVDKSQMDDAQLADFSINYFFKGEFERSREVALYGAAKSPRYAALNRMAFYTNTELKDYDQALIYADRLWIQSDSVKIAAFDYQYLSSAHLGAKNYDKSIEASQTILTLEDANEDAKLGALKNISDAYNEQNDYANAIPAYKKYLDAKPNATATDYAGLGTLYTYQANELSGAEQEAAVANADNVYAELANKFDDAAEFATFQRARVAGIIDPTLAKGKAKPHYDKLIEIITAEGTPEGASKTRLLQAYQYNMIYALQIQDDVEASKAYAAKVLELDPDNAQANMVITK